MLVPDVGGVAMKWKGFSVMTMTRQGFVCKGNARTVSVVQNRKETSVIGSMFNLITIKETSFFQLTVIVEQKSNVTASYSEDT